MSLPCKTFLLTKSVAFLERYNRILAFVDTPLLQSEAPEYKIYFCPLPFKYGFKNLGVKPYIVALICE
jgi:hypothetical protein